jgi:hypothetical protein
MPDTKPLVINFSNGIYGNTEWELDTISQGEERYYFHCKSLMASVTAKEAQSYSWRVFNRSMLYMGISGGIIAQGHEPSMHLAMQMCMNVLTSIYDFSEIQSCSKQS